MTGDEMKYLLRLATKIQTPRDALIALSFAVSLIGLLYLTPAQELLDQFQSML